MRDWLASVAPKRLGPAARRLATVRRATARRATARRTAVAARSIATLQR